MKYPFVQQNYSAAWTYGDFAEKKKLIKNQIIPMTFPIVRASMDAIE